MAIQDSEKLDLLFKKLFGAAKSDTASKKLASNELTASYSLLRSDKLWAQSSSIPATPPSSTSAIVQVYTLTASKKCTADTSTSTVNGSYVTWLTGLNNWITPEFGSQYFVKVYADLATNTNPQSTGTQLDANTSGNEWWFDYQAGTLNFIGGTPPTVLSGKVIWIVGYRYIGSFGIDASGFSGTLAVGSGGTGTTSFTTNGILIGANTSAVGTISTGSAYSVLRTPAGGGAPAFGAIDLSQSAAVTGSLPTGSVTGLDTALASKISTGSLNEFSAGKFTNYNGASFDLTGPNNVKIQGHSSGAITGVVTVTNATAVSGYATYTVATAAPFYLGMQVYVNGITGGTSAGVFSDTGNGMVITSIVGNVITTNNPVTVSGTPTYSSASMYNADSSIANSLDILRDGVSIFNVSGSSSSLGASINAAGDSLKFNNTTNNRIKFPTAGLGGPTVNSYSNGVKIVFYDSVGAFSTGDAMGVESGALWFGVANSGDAFKWYAGTNRVATLSGDGMFTSINNIPITQGTASVGTTGKYFVITSSSSGKVYFPTSNIAGREVTIVSASPSSTSLISYNSAYTSTVANIYPRGSTTLGSVIAASSIGAWATLVCTDGTNWQVVASSV